MEWPTITAVDALTRLKRGARAVDVRSRGEFEKGHLPHFTNTAILNNEHRHQVGLTYKESGQDAAVELGFQLVSPLRPQLVREWRSVLEAMSPDMRLLTCWRGGLRSKISAQWLADDGFEGVRVVGGYKQMRGELLRLIEKPPEFLVLGGLTGSGKTDLLRGLAPRMVLDLELYANHRGSSFGLGMKAEQPSQQSFENALGFALLDAPAQMIVEAESRMIGRCAIPANVKTAMDKSPMVVLDSTMEERVQRIFVEYVEEPLRHVSANEVLDHLQAALLRVQKRLGGLRYQEIRGQLFTAFLYREVKIEKHAPWIESLLREYYDPQYEFALKSKERPIAFRGDWTAVREFLMHSLRSTIVS